MMEYIERKIIEKKDLSNLEETEQDMIRILINKDLERLPMINTRNGCGSRIHLCPTCKDIIYNDEWDDYDIKVARSNGRCKTCGQRISYIEEWQNV